MVIMRGYVVCHAADILTNDKSRAARTCVRLTSGNRERLIGNNQKHKTKNGQSKKTIRRKIQ